MLRREWCRSAREKDMSSGENVSTEAAIQRNEQGEMTRKVVQG